MIAKAKPPSATYRKTNKIIKMNSSHFTDKPTKVSIECFICKQVLHTFANDEVYQISALCKDCAHQGTYSARHSNANSDNAIQSFRVMPNQHKEGEDINHLDSQQEDIFDERKSSLSSVGQDTADKAHRFIYKSIE